MTKKNDRPADAALPLLSPPRTDWNGVWVWTQALDKDRNAYAFFRRRFDSPAAGTLDLSISADSSYVLYLDGEFVCRGPARSQLDYYSFDVLRLPVAAGRHAVAILAHHIGEINATVMTGRPGLLVDGGLTAAGRTQDLSTAAGWTCLAATTWRRDLPCMMSHFGFGEDCDLRQLPAGWTQPDFDDSAWTPPAVVGKPPCPPWPRLCPRDIPLPRYADIPVTRWSAMGAWRAGGPADPIPSKTVAARARSPEGGTPALPLRFDLAEGPGGRYVVADFGRTVSGYVVLDFADSAAGQCVELSYDDFCQPDGAVNPERSYAHMTDRFVLPGGRCRIRTAHPRGFRYVMVDVSGAGRLSIQRVHAVEETYPLDLQDAFRSPDEALNGFVRKAAETVRICTTDAFTDCATRERVQWMEDLYMHSRVAMYAFGDTRLLRRALFQGAQGALPDGRINGFFPSERTNCAFAASSVAWLHLLVDYWLFAGDGDIGRLLPAARRLLDLFAKLQDGDGLIASWPAGQFWDWAPIEIEAEGCLLLTNAAYIWALERVGGHSVLRHALGGDPTAKIAALRRAAHARFWDAGRGLYRDAVPREGLTPIYSQQANAMAVLGGVCPPAERAALLRRIIDPANLGPVPVGENSLNKENRPAPDRIVPVGTLWFGHFLCQALFEEGLDVEALDQMRSLWGAHDALPTFPETRNQKGNTFLCHGWAGGPAFLLPAYVLGVRPVGPGWKEVEISPHPGGLAKARGTIATPLGPLTVSWTCPRGKLKVSTNPPVGMTIH